MQSSFFVALLTVSISLLLSVQPGSCKNEQSLRFWNASGCTGDPFASTAVSTNDIQIPAGIVVFYYQVNGLWKIQHCYNVTTCPSAPVIAHGSGGDCAQRFIGAADKEVHVIRYGDANQVEERITFFEEPRFEGPSFSVTPDTPLTDAARRVQSYFFTGPSSWQHKSSEAAEEGVCVNATAAVDQNGYGFTYELTVDLQVGWVRHECNVTGEPTTTVTTPPPTTTVTTPPPTTTVTTPPPTTTVTTPPPTTTVTTPPPTTTVTTPPPTTTVTTPPPTTTVTTPPPTTTVTTPPPTTTVTTPPPTTNASTTTPPTTTVTTPPPTTTVTTPPPTTTVTTPPPTTTVTTPPPTTNASTTTPPTTTVTTPPPTTTVTTPPPTTTVTTPPPTTTVTTSPPTTNASTTTPLTTTTPTTTTPTTTTTTPTTTTPTTTTNSTTPTTTRLTTTTTVRTTTQNTTTEASTEPTTESSGYTHALGILPVFLTILATICFQF